jgi:membrane protease YdiL (CAAX protease family)
MDTNQIIALIMPIVLLAIMYPIFQLLSRKFGNQAGWFWGLVTYWLLWGIVFSFALVGKETIINLVRPQKFTFQAVTFTAIPIIFAAIGRIFMGIKYEKASVWLWLGLLVTAVGNGLFEEILWRGTYLALFPGSILFQIIWPSVWFGIWHYAPGSVSSRGNVRGLMVGAIFLGLFLSLLAKQTDTIWWSILGHTLAGIVMVT